MVLIEVPTSRKKVENFLSVLKKNRRSGLSPADPQKNVRVSREFLFPSCIYTKGSKDISKGFTFEFFVYLLGIVRSCPIADVLKGSGSSPLKCA